MEVEEQVSLHRQMEELEEVEAVDLMIQMVVLELQVKDSLVVMVLQVVITQVEVEVEQQKQVTQTVKDMVVMD